MVVVLRERSVGQISGQGQEKVKTGQDETEGSLCIYTYIHVGVAMVTGLASRY
jgi:hypothetical protein